jgi:hypothetical protein
VKINTTKLPRDEVYGEVFSSNVQIGAQKNLLRRIVETGEERPSSLWVTLESYRTSPASYGIVELMSFEVSAHFVNRGSCSRFDCPDGGDLVMA